jgi:hypothetical protein
MEPTASLRSRDTQSQDNPRGQRRYDTKVGCGLLGRSSSSGISVWQWPVLRIGTPSEQDLLLIPSSNSFFPTREGNPSGVPEKEKVHLLIRKEFIFWQQNNIMPRLTHGCAGAAASLQDSLCEVATAQPANTMFGRRHTVAGTSCRCMLPFIGR